MQKYGVSWERLRRKLIELGVKLRPHGRRKGSENPNCRKIDKSGHQKIAHLHIQGLTHAEIGRQLGITRERVRQIVAGLGLSDRTALRKKLAAERRKAKAKERREKTALRRRVIKSASTLWKKGAHWTEVADALGWKCTRAGGFHSALGDLREKHGAAAFPIRQPKHWNSRAI